MFFTERSEVKKFIAPKQREIDNIQILTKKKENNMTIPQVQLLMLSSKTVKEWNDNCDKVKKEFNGYPEWWYAEIIVSSIAKAFNMYDAHSIPKHTFINEELVDKLFNNNDDSFVLKTVDEI